MCNNCKPQGTQFGSIFLSDAYACQKQFRELSTQSPVVLIMQTWIDSSHTATVNCITGHRVIVNLHALYISKIRALKSETAESEPIFVFFLFFVFCLWRVWRGESAEIRKHFFCSMITVPNVSSTTFLKGCCFF